MATSQSVAEMDCCAFAAWNDEHMFFVVFEVVIVVAAIAGLVAQYWMIRHGRRRLTARWSLAAFALVFPYLLVGGDNRAVMSVAVSAAGLAMIVSVLTSPNLP